MVTVAGPGTFVVTVAGPGIIVVTVAGPGTIVAVYWSLPKLWLQKFTKNMVICMFIPREINLKILSLLSVVV